MKSSSRTSMVDPPTIGASPVASAAVGATLKKAVAHEAGDAEWSTPFKSEREVIPPAPRRTPRRQISVAVAGVVACIAAGWFVWQTATAAPAASASVNAVAATGTADFNSVPEGSSVAIDGRFRGVTPLRIAVDAGTHSVTFTSGSVSRTLPITVTPGGSVSQYVEFATAQAPAGGRLEIGSDPPGAQVAMDGVAKGRTPLVLTDVAPGQYRISVSAGGSTVNRTVTVTRGTTSSLVFSTPPPVAPNAAAGWLAIQSPIDMDILEDGRVIGNTKMDRLMLPVGAHRLELANASLEFRAARTVEIAAGGTANVVIALPSGRLSVNAVPWAEVLLNGAALGTTPLGSLAVPIGTHELTFRHPQFGERRQTVTVKAQTAARIGIDLRK